MATFHSLGFISDELAGKTACRKNEWYPDAEALNPNEMLKIFMTNNPAMRIEIKAYEK